MTRTTSTDEERGLDDRRLGRGRGSGGLRILAVRHQGRRVELARFELPASREERHDLQAADGCLTVGRIATRSGSV